MTHLTFEINTTQYPHPLKELQKQLKTSANNITDMLILSKVFLKEKKGTTSRPQFFTRTGFSYAS